MNVLKVLAFVVPAAIIVGGIAVTTAATILAYAVGKRVFERFKKRLETKHADDLTVFEQEKINIKDRIDVWFDSLTSKIKKDLNKYSDLHEQDMKTVMKHLTDEINKIEQAKLGSKRLVILHDKLKIAFETLQTGKTLSSRKVSKAMRGVELTEALEPSMILVGFIGYPLAKKEYFNNVGKTQQALSNKIVELINKKKQWDSENMKSFILKQFNKHKG